MIKKTIPEEAEKVNTSVDGRIMFKNEKTESIMLKLSPEEHIPEHTNPFDVLFIGIKGRATLICNNQILDLNTCETIFISAEVLRSVKNSTNEEAILMVVKMLS